MKDELEQVTISNFKKRIIDYAQDPDAEVVVTRSGIPIGIFMGVSAWRARQETFNVLKNNPEALLRSLIMHRRYKETGQPVGISLADFELLLKQKKLKD